MKERGRKGFVVLRERPISELYGKERGTSMGVDESIVKLESQA